jgi:hypothetical protein
VAATGAFRARTRLGPSARAQAGLLRATRRAGASLLVATAVERLDWADHDLHQGSGAEGLAESGVLARHEASVSPTTHRKSRPETTTPRLRRRVGRRRGPRRGPSCLLDTVLLLACLRRSGSCRHAFRPQEPRRGARWYRLYRLGSRLRRCLLRSRYSSTRKWKRC